MNIPESIRDVFGGVPSEQMIGEENPGTLDTHPLFFIWEKIHTIEQEFPRDELEDHFLVTCLTTHPSTNHQSYKELLAEWENDIKNQEQQHLTDHKSFLGRISSLTELVDFLIEVDECMWISKLDEALRGDATFKALIIWLLSQGREWHGIFETIHNTRDPETDITYSSYGEDEFFAEEHYDATDCESVTDKTTIDQLPIPSSIHRVEKDGDFEARRLFKEKHGQLVKICSDPGEITTFLNDNNSSSSKEHFIQVPERTHIPLCISHFTQACMTIQKLRHADTKQFHSFLSAGGHPGTLSYNNGRPSFENYNKETKDSPEGFGKGYGRQQDDQGQDVFIIFLKIDQLAASFDKRLPAALNEYKSKHSGLPIGIVAYGPGMWEIFSRLLFVGCEDEGVIENVNCLLHFTNAGEPKTEASSYTPTGGRGWKMVESKFTEPRGYWTE